MRTTASLLLAGSLWAAAVQAAPIVDTAYPYTGPAIPVGDWDDPTINGNGKGFVRVKEPPAVAPATKNATNNINVIQLSYLPGGMHVHYQTPFGIGSPAAVHWGTSPTALKNKSTGSSHTYVH